MENQAPTLKDYLRIIKRQRKYFVIPLALISILSIMLAVLLPPEYMSTATILIEEQEVPPELVHSTVTTFADQRIQVISQRIMSRPNLMEIIKKFDLYAKERKKLTQERITEKMRKKIQITPISADVVTNNGAKSKATIAFTLAFNDKSPAMSQQVTNELTSLFLKENIKSRTESAENTALFLSEGARRLKEKVKQIQDKLATFKEKNLNQLPQISQLNQQELTTLSGQLLNLDAQERSLRERQFYLEGELAQIDPNSLVTNAVGNRVFDAKDRLKVLEAEYPALVASYSADHPDVIKARREIESLRKQAGNNTGMNDMNAELTSKRADLAELLKLYSDKHPDVIKLKKQISSLKKSMTFAKDINASNNAIKPDNPAYITLKAQLEGLGSELKSLQFTRRQINEKMESLRRSLREAPMVEKEYTDLIQELDNTNIRYREVSGREMEAQISQQLEVERKGERFTLIDPPQEPLEPVSPNRPAILLLGFMFALISGMGCVFLAEKISATVNNEKAILTVLGVAPLASIPYLENEQERDADSKRRMLLITSILIIFAITVIAFHYFVMPLDVFWYKLLHIIDEN